MKYMLYCYNCNNKIFTNGSDLEHLRQAQTAPIQRKGDGKSKETIEQKKKFKCPQCGYIFKIVKLDAIPEKETKKEEERVEPRDIFTTDPKRRDR